MIPIPQKWAIRFKAMEENREVMEKYIYQYQYFFLNTCFLLFIIGIQPAIFEEFYSGPDCKYFYEVDGWCDRRHYF